MITIAKNITDIENIHTYFEFCGYDGWDEFDKLFLILTNVMGCHASEKLEGIYSRHCTLEKDGFVFKLIYHEDFGNCLCNQYKKDDQYYNILEKLAHEAASIANE